MALLHGGQNKSHFRWCHKLGHAGQEQLNGGQMFESCFGRLPSGRAALTNGGNQAVTSAPARHFIAKARRNV